MDESPDVSEIAVQLAVDGRCIRHFDVHDTQAIAGCRVAGRRAARQLGLRARTMEVPSAVTGRVSVIIVAIDRDNGQHISADTEALIRKALESDV